MSLSDESAPQVDAHATPEPTSQLTHPGFRWNSSPNLWCLAALIVVMSLVGLSWLFFGAIHERVPVFDSAVLMIITYLGIVLCIVILAGWTVFLSRLQLAIRVGACCFLVLGIGFLCMLRPELDGNLFPRGVRFFWQKPPDMTMAAPEVSQETQERTTINFESISSDTALTAVEIETQTGVDPLTYFSQYRGPNRLGRLPGPQLAADWDVNPPEELWRSEIGAGWSGFVAANGYAVTMEQRGESEFVTCYEIETGEIVWFHTTKTRHEDPLGKIGPRSTPAIHLGNVYTIGANGMLLCLDGATGEEIWSHDMFEILRTSIDEQAGLVTWGRSGSPLIYDDKVIVPGGGSPTEKFVSLFAFDLLTGEEVWRGGEKQISYVSPLVAKFNDQDHIVTFNESEIAGHHPDDGRVLWSFERFGQSNAASHTAQPVVLEGNKIVLTKGYGMGAQVIQVNQDGDDFSTESVWSNPRLLKTKFANIVEQDGYLFGLSDGFLECVQAETGETMWKARRDGYYGHGQLLMVGDKLLVLSELGELALVSVRTDEFEELARIHPLEGVTWNTLCLIGDRLLIRNSQEAVCLRLPLRDEEAVANTP